MNSETSAIIDERASETLDLLSRLIAFPSTVGNEREIQQYLLCYAQDLGFDAALAPIHQGIEGDEDYTIVPDHRGYEGRSNLILKIPGTGGGRSIVLNSHVDVVPAPDELFTPGAAEGVLHGRGAVDAKGQVVTVLLALIALKEAGIRLKGDMSAQFVIEEEAGGNGALSMILDGMRADGVVVLEPTGLRAYPANRGAVWFKLSIEGKPTHMGRWRDGINAIDEMMDALRTLKEYERKLIVESAGDPLFPDVAANVKLNVGQIQGGSWPATLAGECAAEGGIGFLPNKRLADIRSEMRRAIETNASAWVRDHFTLEFSRLHNEAYRMPPEHPLFRTLYESVVSHGQQSDITGWTASCDARLFWHRGEMPTVVFGPGEFSRAHALDEQISVEEISLGARILADFLIRWCSRENTDDTERYGSDG